MSGGRRRRSVVDFGNAQVADVTTRDSAGGDIINEGADFGAVLAFLKEYTFQSDQRRETTIKEVRAELEALRGELAKRERYTAGEARIASEALTVVRGQVERIVGDAAVEKEERKRRQGERDAMDAQIAADLRALRRWQFWQGLIIGAIVVAVALVAFFGWQAVYGAGLAVAAGLAARILGR